MLTLVAAGDCAAADPPAGVDRVHASVPVPDAKRRLGVVRLLSRGEAVVVQTLLETRLLARAVAEIRAKERKNWGADHAESAVYLAALDSALAELERRAQKADDRRGRLLVEFVADQGSAAVLVGTYASSDVGAAARLEGREVFTTQEPSREWVLRQIRLVLADSFDVPESEVDRIGPLGPAALPRQPEVPGALPGQPATDPR